VNRERIDKALAKVKMPAGIGWVALTTRERAALAPAVEALIREAVDEALEAAAVAIEDSPERRPVEWHNGMDHAASIVRSHKGPH
jgi:hypothetical protein